MDIFCDSRDITTRFEQYVIDLRRLFVFHGVACGGAEGLVALGVKLEESKAFRLDLPGLLRNIHDLAGDRMTADEMLTILALASGGADLVDGRLETVGLMRIVTLLRVLVAGAGAWSEEGDRGFAGREVEAGERVSVDESPRAAIELSLEQLRRELSEIDRRIHRLEPREVAVAPEMVMGVQGIVAGVPEVGMGVPEEREDLPGGGHLVELPGFAWTGGDDDMAAGAASADGVREFHGGLREGVDDLREVGAAYVSGVAAVGGAAARWVAARVRSSPWRVGGAVAAGVSLLFSLSAIRVVSSRHARTSFAAAATRPAGGRAMEVQPSGSALPAPTEHVEAPATVRATPPRAVPVEAPVEDAAAAATIVRVTPAVMERKLVTSRKPVFPAAALAEGKDGTVVLNTFIAKNGSVSRMDVLSGAPPFVDSAMAAVSWRQYRPYLLRGRPVEVVTPVTVTYHAP